MEYLNLYDENKKLTEKTILRGDKPEKGYYVGIVIVFIENSKGQFLIQKTSVEKGSIWATTGGLVKAGSTPDITIVEEIDMDINELKHIIIDKRKYSFQDVYYIKKDIEIDDLILQKEEVEYVKWLSVDEINELIDICEEKSKHKTGISINIALNYGGRLEICQAVKKIAQNVKDGNVNVEDIDEKMISDNLYTYDVPDPDLIIRPSGEYRLSNFLLWQCAYSEFWYSNVFWPDFTTKKFEDAIIDYQLRNRRFGGV